MSGWCVITDAPVCRRERGVGGLEGCGSTISISVVMHTWIHQFRGGRRNIPGWCTITETLVCMRLRGGDRRGGCVSIGDISCVIHNEIHQLQVVCVHALIPHFGQKFVNLKEQFF
jgi:hypothetical protein